MLLVSYVGLVTNRTVVDYWCTAPLVVTAFDFRRATLLYTGTPTEPDVLCAQQAAPAAIVCAPDAYEMFSQRVSTLNALGVRRALFCSLALALEWAEMQAHLSRARSAKHTHGPRAPVHHDL